MYTSGMFHYVETWAHYGELLFPHANFSNAFGISGDCQADGANLKDPTKLAK